MNVVVRGVLLVVIWLALWAEISVANVVAGVLVAGAILLLFGDRARAMPFRPIAAARFGGYFVFQLFKSTWVVARTVIAPANRINRGIVAVPLVGCTDAVATVIADAISLTPGTLTVEVERDPLVLYVHALDVRDLEQVRTDVRQLELLAVRAFGDEAALAGLEIDDSEVMPER